MIQAEINETDSIEKSMKRKIESLKRQNWQYSYQDWQKGEEREREGQRRHELPVSGMKQWVLL